MLENRRLAAVGVRNDLFVKVKVARFGNVARNRVEEPLAVVAAEFFRGGRLFVAGVKVLGNDGNRAAVFALAADHADKARFGFLGNRR